MGAPGQTGTDRLDGPAGIPPVLDLLMGLFLLLTKGTGS